MPKWPLKPTNISIATNPGDQETIASPYLGIISNAHLRGVLTEIAAQLQNPVTMLEFPSGATGESSIRTDSYSFHFDLHPPCKQFRDCTETAYCQNCDVFHAELFRGLTAQNLRQQVQERITSNQYRQRFRQYYQLDPNIKTGGDGSRVFLEYDCPILGYRELVFPVLFEGDVLAAFFLGELVIEGQEKKIDQLREHFFTLHKRCFDEYNKKNALQPPITSGTIAGLDAEWKNKRENVWSQKKYLDLITNAFEQLGMLDERLHNEMVVKRKNFISEKIQDYVEDFRKPPLSSLPIGDPGLEILWRNISLTLERMKEDFPVEHMCVFGKKNFIRDRSGVLEKVACTGIDPQPSNNFYFDLACIPDQKKNMILTSAEHPFLFEGLKGVDLNPRQDLIRVFPSSASPQNVIVIWVRYDNKVWPRLEQRHEESDTIFDDGILSFYTVLVSSYSSLWAASATDLLEKSWRVLTHETGQMITGLDGIREQYISNPLRLKSLTEEKINDINHDIEGFLRQLFFIGKNTKQVISGGLVVNKEPFLAFHDILYKWRNTFRLETLKKTIRLMIQDTYKEDPERPEVIGDKYLLEQLVFNLVDNAVKYSYRGTNIWLDCKKDPRDPDNPHILTVVNFGIGIVDDDIYELFRRGKNVEGMAGLGIGLYIAKQIAEAHGGRISHTSKMVSPFNVPLLYPYLQLDSSETSIRWKKDETLIQEIKEELDRLVRTGLIPVVLSQKSTGEACYSPSFGELITSIRKGTFRTEFRVEIPAH